MSQKDFENIRPYFDSEVAKIAKGLATAIDWFSMLSPLIGKDNAEEIVESMPHIETTAEFQDELTFPFLEALIEGTTSHVSVSFDNNDIDDFFS